jgi:hypothetical protein
MTRIIITSEGRGRRETKATIVTTSTISVENIGKMNKHDRVTAIKT